MKAPTPKEWRDYRLSQVYHAHIEQRLLNNGTTVTMARLGPAKNPGYVGYSIVKTDGIQVSSVEQALEALTKAIHDGVQTVVLTNDPEEEEE